MTEYETVSKSVKIDVIDGLKDRLPQIFEEGKINLEKLKALLTGEIAEKEDDRFYFNWAGKSKLFKLIQEPGYGTLKPDKERSIDFDNTENMVIVGENLETLKLLLKPYFGKVKMIYIDPPYNTGKDFIYKDRGCPTITKQPTDNISCTDIKSSSSSQHPFTLQPELPRIAKAHPKNL